MKAAESLITFKENTLTGRAPGLRGLPPASSRRRSKLLEETGAGGRAAAIGERRRESTHQPLQRDWANQRANSGHATEPRRKVQTELRADFFARQGITLCTASGPSGLNEASGTVAGTPRW
jgi:hypothetical protein